MESHLDYLTVHGELLSVTLSDSYIQDCQLQHRYSKMMSTTCGYKECAMGMGR